MMCTIRFLILLFAAFFLSRCGSEVTSSENEVLRIHDEVMPFMDDMKHMRRQLIKLEPADSNLQLRITVASQNLHKADSMMWQWMYQYKNVHAIRDSLSKDQLLDYIENQKQRIIVVNHSMKSAMHEAEELLKIIKTK